VGKIKEGVVLHRLTVGDRMVKIQIFKE